VVKPKKTKKQVQQEIGLLGKALRHLGGMAGGAAGAMIGAPTAGAAAGSGLGAAISKWLGSGDYTVGSNSIVSSMRASGSIPAMHTNDQTVIVRHKEFLMEVKSATSFTVQRSFTINPGNQNTFPWLHGIANAYQQYRVKGLVFHYIPTSGSLSSGTSNALGTVMMQTSYRANDSPPGSKIELLNEFWSTESVPFEAFAHPIECNPNENPFNVQYIKSSDAIIPPGDSPLLYDLGTTHVAVSGQQAAGISLGDLYVTYEIELKKPILVSNVASGDFKFAAYVANATFADPFSGLTRNQGNFNISGRTGRQIVIPAPIYGIFWVVVAYIPATSFTNGSATGAPTITNGVIDNWAGYADRYEQNTTGGGVQGNMIYAFKFAKSQRESESVITLPLATATAGTCSFTNVTIFGADSV